MAYKMNNIPTIKINLSHKLLGLKLVWHGILLKDILIKYKILIIFVLLLLAPNIHGLINFIILPVKEIVNKNHTVLNYFLSILGYQAIAIIWFYLQSTAFKRQSWQNYIDSLPLTRNQLIYVDFNLLLITNLVIWSPLFIATYIALSHNNHTANEIVVLVEHLASIMLLIINLQLISKKDQYSKISYILILNGLLLICCQVNNYIIQSSIFLLFIIISYYLLQRCYDPQSKTCFNKIIIKKNEKLLKILDFNIILLPVVRVESKQLILDNAVQLLQFVIIMSIICVVIFYFSKYSSQTPNFYFITFSLNLLGTISLSHLFAKLDIQRKSYQSYLKSLPQSRYSVFYSHYIFVGLLQFIFFIILSAIIYINTSINFNLLALEFILAMLFLASTYYPQITYKKYGTIVSFLMLTIFVCANYILVNYMNG